MKKSILEIIQILLKRKRNELIIIGIDNFESWNFRELSSDGVYIESFSLLVPNLKCFQVSKYRPNVG